MKKHWDHSYKTQTIPEATWLACMREFTTCACAHGTKTYNSRNTILKICALRHTFGVTTKKLDTPTREFITSTTEGSLLATDMDNSEFKHFEEQKRQLLEEIILHLKNRDVISPSQHILQVFLHLVSLTELTNILRANQVAYSSPYE